LRATTTWMLGCIALVALAGRTAPAEVTSYAIASMAVGQSGEADALRRAQSLLRSAPEAIQAGKYAEAERLIAQAEATGARFDPLKARWADTPAKLRKELEQTKSGAAASPAERKRVASGYLDTARKALQRGDKQSAVQFYQKAVAQKASFTAGEFSPLMLATELRKAGISPAQLNAPAATGGLTRLPPVASNADRTGSNPAPQPNQFSQTGQRQVQTVGDSTVKVYEFPGSNPRPADTAQPRTPASRVKLEALRLVAEAQAALDRNEVYLAEQLIDRAESLRVPDTAFVAGETRPWEVRMQIDRAVARGADVRQASATEGSAPYRPQRYPARQGIYRPENDNTRNVPANQLTGPENFDPRGGFNPNVVDNNARPSIPPEIDMEVPEEAAPQLYQEGLEALQRGQREHALFFFRHAWRFEEQLDPAFRQQIQDKLAQLSVADNPKPPRPLEPREDLNPVPPSALESADDEQTVLRQRLFREITAETNAAERMKRDDPRGARDKIEALRERVDAAQLDSRSKRQLLLLVDKSLTQLNAYIKQNLAQIELDEANDEVRDNIKRQQRMRLESQDKLAQLVEEFNVLMDQGRHYEAEVIAKQANEIAPDEEVVRTMLWKSKFVRSYNEQVSIRQRSERGFVDQMAGVDESAIPFNDRNPYVFPDLKEWDGLSRRRSELLRDRNTRLSESELEIQASLKKPVEVSFSQRPLAEVVATLGKMAGVNVHLDPQGLAAEGVTSDTPVDLDLEQPISLKSALNLILEPLRLSYVIQDEVLKITSEQTRESDVYAEVYNVADLVIPIPNFVPSYNLGLPGAIAAAHRNVGVGGMVGSQANVPLTLAQNSDASAIDPLTMANVGLEGYNSSRAPQNVGAGPGGLGGGVQADFDSLIELITTTIAPTWDEVGGAGAVSPFETNLSLVVSQTQDVHEQIADLLDQLRRLQDLQVTIEVRFITLSDDFFERIGIDFDFQIDDNVSAANNPLLNPQNEDTSPSITVGLGQDGLPTADLDLTFNQDSFGSAVPTFGGFDAATAANFGFAILSDIEVFFLLQASQGDQRTNVLQAPKVTLFNGQQAFVSDTAQTPFVTSIVPVVGDFAVGQQPVITVLSEGTSLSVQAVVSSDRRFVRLTLVPFFSRIGEVTEFTFEGSVSSDSGSVVVDPSDDEDTVTNNEQITRTGTTVQLPTFAFTTVTTTVSVPDGGTVLLGGIKRLSEGRNERGVPMLSKVPYINRLFKNVGIGRTSQSLMMMVTPRIIIQEEEEERLGIDTDL